MERYFSLSTSLIVYTLNLNFQQYKTPSAVPYFTIFIRIKRQHLHKKKIDLKNCRKVF